MMPRNSQSKRNNVIAYAKFPIQKLENVLEKIENVAM
jgi:hypothetical protein